MTVKYKHKSAIAVWRIAATVFGLILLAGSPLWSQENEQPPEFLAELMLILQREGWTAAEVRALVAQNVDWEDAEGADPEVVALALQFAKNEDSELQPMEQALLAIELARTAIEMESLGIGELTIALTTLEGVRELLLDIQAFRSGVLAGNLGETIRDKMGVRMSQAAREQARGRLHERARKALESVPWDLIPEIPASGDGFPGSGYSTWW